MKSIVTEFGKVIIVMVVTTIFFSLLPFLFTNISTIIKADQSVILGDSQILDDLEKPTLVIEVQTVEYQSVFNYKDYVVEATSASGNSLVDKVVMYGSVDTSIRGGYDVTYIVYDEYDLRTTYKCSFVVE